MSRANELIARWRGWLFPWISLAYLGLICGLPTAGALALLRYAGPFHLLVTISVPIIWTVAFVVVAGTLSIPHRFSVRPGKFRRCVDERLYYHRRVYGLCWTVVYYNKPVYFLCLSLPPLKWLTFRLFGYRGSMNFTVYPDTWIRDLPLLDFEDGAYVSNRATLGTNIVLNNGFLLVDCIKLRSNSLVGHLAMLAPGVELESGAEVGVGSAIGIKTKIGNRAFVGPCCVIEHGVKLGDNTAVGAHSYLGSASILPDNMRLPGGTLIPPRTRVRTTIRAEVDILSPEVVK